MDKTTKQWFEGIEDPEVRKRALANMMPSQTNEIYTHLSPAIMCGLPMFDKTVEGDKWWQKINLIVLEHGNIPVGEYPLNPVVNKSLTVQKEEDQWISVKDGLPEDDRSVIAFHSSGFISMVHHIDGKFYEMWGDNKIPYNVTHWTILNPPNLKRSRNEEKFCKCTSPNSRVMVNELFENWIECTHCRKEVI